MRAQVYKCQTVNGKWSFEIHIGGNEWAFGDFYPEQRDALDAACAELRKRAES